jgi:hypothetical protein
MNPFRFGRRTITRRTFATFRTERASTSFVVFAFFFVVFFPFLALILPINLLAIALKFGRNISSAAIA